MENRFTFGRFWKTDLLFGFGKPIYENRLTMKTYSPLNEYRSRNLPHWQTPDGVYFITFRLKDSLPKEVINRLRYEKEMTKNELLTKGLSEEELKIELQQLRHLYFGKFDDLLDKTKQGPNFLKEPKVAKIVGDSIMYFDEERYKIICYIIMSNHVHLVFYKLQMEIQDILGSIKKFSARKINELHDKKGRTVWLAESYDHLIWSRKELAHWVTYTLNNSTKIGLVKHWKDFPYCYLREGFEDFVNRFSKTET